jgi:hypothetical protein
MNGGRTLKKARVNNDLSSEIVKWRKVAADRNKWRAICGSKGPRATKETPMKSRQDIVAELQHGTMPARVQNIYLEIP